MLDDFELEKKEKQYFDFILLQLKEHLEVIINGLNSRLKIMNDWYSNFIRTARKGYKASDLDVGAERIFHNFFATFLRFPNSSPIGSDLMFEVTDAFLHIDIKTALFNNPADYKGKVNISINQTSYEVDEVFKPNLPQYYKINSRIKKPCLTYIIQIIHEHAKPDIKAIKLICIPNGQLYKHYGKDIFKSGKGGYAKGKDFRYNYSAKPYFILLSNKYGEKIFRIELIYLAKDINKKEITNLEDVPVHFQF